MIGDDPWGRRIFKALVRGGYTTAAAVHAASDADLARVKSIGAGAVHVLRDRRRGEGETLPSPPPEPAPAAVRLASAIERAMVRRQTPPSLGR
ncbi:hypothetical protein [Nonomuraea sp. NPDC049646]|uniref:hypothetical protein n=1 Tax=unclassified Nonomuraea TaxID=2593643 RepID=UPI0037BD5A14